MAYSYLATYIMSSAIKCPCKICKNNVTNSDQAI